MRLLSFRRSGLSKQSKSHRPLVKAMPSFLTEVLEQRVMLSADAWKNAISGDWDTASDWSTGAVPTASSAVTLPTGTYTITHNASATDSAASITGNPGAMLSFSAGNLSVTGNISLGGSLIIYSGNLSAGNFSSTAALTLQGGDLIVAGNTTIGGNLTVYSGTLNSGNVSSNANEFITLSGGNITTAGNISLGGNLTLSGGTLNGGNILGGTGASVVLTTSGGTLNDVTIAAGTTVDGTAYAYPNSNYANVTGGLILNGTINLGGSGYWENGKIFFEGTQTLSGNGTVVLSPANNVGSIYAMSPDYGVTSATLTIGSQIIVDGGNGTICGDYSGDSIINYGNITASVAGGAIQIGTHGQTFANYGNLAAPSGTLNLAGNFTVVGNISNTGGTVDLTGTLNNTGHTLTVTGYLTLESNGTINGGNISSGAAGAAVVMTGSGTLAGVTINAGMTVDDIQSYGQGTITGGLTLNGTLNLGGSTSFDTLYFRGAGAQTLSGSGNVIVGNYTYGYWYYGTWETFSNAIYAQGNASGCATLNIASGISIYGGNLTISGCSSGDSIINYGNITANQSGPIFTIGSYGQTFANYGNLTATSGGTLNFDGNFTTVGTIINSGGTVNLAGTLNNSGTLALTGSMNLTGGTISGGTISDAGGASVVLTNNGGTLAGVTISGSPVSGTDGGATITGGLTLNGTLSLKDAGLTFQGAGTQTLAGTGTVEFEESGSDYLQSQGDDLGNSTTLDIGGNITVTVAGVDNTIVGVYGGDSIINNGNISLAAGSNLTIGGTGTGTLTNNGNISATNANLVIGGTGSWTNSGNISISTGSTLDLAGSFTTAGLGTVHHSDSQINLTGTLNNANATTEFTAVTIGNWYLQGGTVSGGIISSDGTAALMLTSSGGTLAGVTIDSTSGTAVDATQGNVSATITGNLTLTGPWHLGAASGPHYGTLYFQGCQTLAGTGSVVFGDSVNDALYAQGDNASNPASLTIDGNITLSGGNGTIGAYYGGDSIINSGNLTTASTDGTITVGGSGTLTNNGTLAVTAGTLNLNSTLNNTGTLAANGSGTMYVYGTLSNSGTLAANSGGTVNLAGNFSAAGLGTISNDGTGTVNLTGSLVLQMPAPSALTITTGDTFAVLKWTDNTSLASGYNIQRSSDGVTFTSIATVPGNAMAYYDTNLPAGTYTYRVAAFNNALSESAYSNTAVATVGVMNTPGLLGQFYNTWNQSGTPALTQWCSPGNNFDVGWGDWGSPGWQVNYGDWSGQWTAKLTVPATGNYTFGAYTYSGITQVWVNGTEVCNTSDPANPGSLGNIYLTTGAAADLKVMFEATSVWDPDMEIDWKGPTMAGWQEIPGSAMTLPAGGQSALPASATGPTMTATQGTGTLALNGSTGSINLDGGSVIGGTISGSGGAAVVLTGSGGTLNGVTADSGVDGSQGNSSATILNGLTVNGTLKLGAADGSSSSQLTFTGNQLLGGAGSVVFGGNASNGLFVQGTPWWNAATLTIGSELTVAGNVGQIGGVYDFEEVVNNGTIDASTSGGQITLDEVGSFTNNGTVAASSGGTLELDGAWSNAGNISVLDSSSVVNLGGTFTQADLGTLNNSNGGMVNLIGTLNNSGTVTLTGNLSLDGGTINGIDGGGTVAATGNATLLLTSNGGTLYNVTIDSSLTVDGTQSDATATIDNNLNVNGTLDLGNGNGSTYGQLTFPGTQWLDGSGIVVFGGNASNALLAQDNGSPATLYMGVTVEGISGQIAALSDDGNIINNGGTINANTSGGNISIIAGGNGTFSNNGTIETTSSGNISISAGGYGTLTNGNWIEATNGGTINITVGANATFTNTSYIDADGNTSGGTINITGGNFTNSGTIEANNGGTLRVQNLTGNVGTALADGTGSDLTLNGTGYIVNQYLQAWGGATLELDGSWSNPGQTIAVTGSTLDLGDQSPASTNEWINGGTISADWASVVNLGGMFTAADLGTFNPNGATVNLVGNLDLLQAPAAPTDLTVGSGENYAVLNWTNNSTVASGYLIELSTDGGVTFNPIRTVGGNVTSYFDTTGNGTGLSAGNTYTYEVAAFNVTGQSAWSNTAATATVGTVTAPGLLSQFYNNTDLGVSEGVGPVLTRVDSNLNFDWAADVAPGTGVDPTNPFSVQWNGTLTVPSDDTYTFTPVVAAGDTAWVTVNGQLVFDNSGDTQAASANSEVALSATTPVTFQVIYQGVANAENQMQVNWSNAGDTVTPGAIPASAFTLPAGAESQLPINTPVSVGVFVPGGDTLTLDNNNTGTWYLDGGAINGGTVASDDGTALVLTGNGGTLNGVTIDSSLTADGTQSNSHATVTNGLIVNGIINLGADDGSTSSQLYFSGTQALDGTGNVNFGANANNGLFAQDNSAGAATLTLTSNITMQGISGQVSVVSADASIVNNGGIYAANSGGTISVGGNGTFTSYGTLEASNGGNISVSGNGILNNNGTMQAFNGGSISVVGTGSFINGASIETSSGGILNLNGNWSNAGTIYVADSSSLVNLGGNFTTTQLGSVYNPNNGTVNLIGTLNMDVTPAAPSGLTVTSGGYYAVLNWTGSDASASGYVIMRSNDGVNFYQIGTVGSDVTTYYDTGLSDTTYWYEVAAYSAAGQSAYCTPVSVQTGPDSIPTPGLLAQFWNNVGDVLALTRVDSDVNFDWGADVAPGTGVDAANGFSASWIGQLNVLNAGDYTFAVTTTGGNACVYVGSTVVYDGLWGQTPTNPIYLSAGTYDFETDYQSAAGAENHIQVRWAYDAGAESVIPASAFTLQGPWATDFPGNTPGPVLAVNPALTTLALDGDSTGSLTLDGGTILGGTVTTANGAELVLTGNGGTLNGVTIGQQWDWNGQVDGTQGNCSVTIVNGLTVNGFVNVGAYDGSTSCQLYFSGTQTLGGIGAINLDGNNSSNGLFVQDVDGSPATLTIDNVYVAGVSGQVTAVSTDGSIVNNGYIGADWTPGGIISVGGNGTFTNSGTLHAGNGETLALHGTVYVNDGGVLQSDSSSFTTVNGDLVGDTTNTSSWSVKGNTTFVGSGNATSPQLLEAMSKDDGNTSSGFTANFAYGNLAVAAGTYVKLVSQSDNAGTARSNAVYAASLYVASGATLDLNGKHLYTYSLTGNGTIENGTVTTVSAGPSLPAWVGSGSVASWDSGSKTLTVTGATTIIGSPGDDPTINNVGATAYVLLVDSSSTVHLGVISGNLSLSMAGNGTLILDDAGTYTGNTTISDGTVQLGVANALPTTTNLTVDGGILDLAGFNQQVACLSDGSVTSGSTVTNSSATAATFTVNQAATTTFGGQIDGNLSLTLSGTGTLTLTASNTYNGGTTINGGLLDVTAATNGLLSGSNVVNNASLEFDGAQTIGELTGTGNLTIGTGTSDNTLKLGTVATPDSFNNKQASITIRVGSTLDITNNTLLLDYGAGATPLAAVQAAVQNGYDIRFGVSGSTDAYGSITSSTAYAGAKDQYAVVYADSTELSSIPTGNVKVMFTLSGDANMDGRVNFNDFSILQNNYDQSGRDWAQGDFNHDGLVNFNDFSILQNNYDANLTAGTMFSSAVIDSAEAHAAAAPAATSDQEAVYGLYSSVTENLFASNVNDLDIDTATYGSASQASIIS